MQVAQRSKDMKTKDYVSAILDWDMADEQMKKGITPSLFEVLIETGKEAMQLIGMDPGLYDPYSDAAQRYIDSRTGKIAADVNDETEKQLRTTLTEGINNGEGYMELRARVEQVMGFAATVRADRISRTEVARAQSAADIMAWDESGVVEGKEWYTALDERRCAFCKDLHGRVVPLDANYFDKGDIQVVETTDKDGKPKRATMHHDYDDVPGCPAHANCRCTLLPVLINV